MPRRSPWLAALFIATQVPPKVEYSLTASGASLNEALGPLGDWGRERLHREGLEVCDVDSRRP
ncbi:winged helix-turn-helix transcriptional regulator [Kytococcus sedentarius]|uniref:winged helix-turn-helix transcriptional regulator n=1 Tax=Kytococcus sedentarius TaxID=1276 RepID=UPI0009D755A0|nr:winged helix-turn-helix transcriptional regulator [Kytococcus sedentarius]QQB64024.1 winged helix-turn-helix transcriptional regulator [Kytococcus sedentarius]STX12986.1 HxlR-like helix-turn-helix [Kytococcus sedentarius]